MSESEQKPRSFYEGDPGDTTEWVNASEEELDALIENETQDEDVEVQS